MKGRAIAAALVTLAATLSAAAATVVERTKLGNAVADVTFVAAGARRAGVAQPRSVRGSAGRIALLDGTEVRVIPAQGARSAARGSGSRALFDFRDLGFTLPPLGLAFLESERMFAVVKERDRLLLIDQTGRPHEERPIRGLDPAGGFPSALAYIPRGSPIYPDHLLILRVVPLGVPRVAIARPDGLVVRELTLPVQWPESAGGVSFRAPDRMLVTTLRGDLLTLDFDGNVVERTPHPDSEVLGSVAQLADGRIVIGDDPSGVLRYYDANLLRLPDADRAYRIEPALRLLNAIAWDSDRDEYLFQSTGEVTAVSPQLDARRTVVDLLSPFRPATDVTYLPDEGLFALALPAWSGEPGQLVLHDADGTEVERLVLQGFSPGSVEYVPATREFQVSHRQDPPWIGTFDRAGTLLRTRRVGHLAIEPHLAYFDAGDPARGRYLVFDRWAQRLWITDLNFAVLGQVDLDTLGVGYAGDLTAIRSGPHAGAFAILEPSNVELVVFRLE